MNNFPKKRTNPFEKPITIQKEDVVEPVINVKEETEDPVVEFEEPEQEVEQYPQTVIVNKKAVQKSTPKQPQKVTRSSSKNSVVYIESDERLKYTATMDRELRRRIKVVCAQRDIMFSQFIEQACIEKLNREGDR